MILGNVRSIPEHSSTGGLTEWIILGLMSIRDVNMFL